MSLYESRIKQKEKEIQEILRQKQDEESQMQRVAPGACFVRRYDGWTSYKKVLYVSDSGYGYPLVIIEGFSFEDLRLFRAGHPDVHVKDKKVNIYTGHQEWNISHFSDYELVTRQEYEKEKQRVWQLVQAEIPPDWYSVQMLGKPLKEANEG